MNTFILSSKTIPDLNSFHQAIKAQVPEFDGLSTEDGVVTVELTVEVTQSLIDQIEAIVPPTISSIQIIQGVVERAMVFGQQLMIEFAAENISLGITQDGMTTIVRKNLSEVISCLSTGSLYDCISEIKLIPAESKDTKYITDARLLVFLNKIETYLNLPLSATL